MQNKEKLDKAIADFEHWRQTRIHKSVSIPDELRYLALELLEEYRIGQVTKALRICTSQINAWRKQFEHHSEEASEFIALPVVTGSSETPSLLEIELKLSADTSLLMRGDVSVDLLRTLIQEARS